MDPVVAVVVMMIVAAGLYGLLVVRGVGIVRSLAITLIFVKLFAGVLYLMGVDRPLFIVHTRIGDATITAMQVLLVTALATNIWLLHRMHDLERYFRAAAIIALLMAPALGTISHAAVTQVVVKQDPQGTPYQWSVAPLCSWQEYVPGYGYQQASLLIGHEVYEKDDWALAKGYKHYNVYGEAYWTVSSKLYDIVSDNNYKVYAEFNGTHLVYASGGLGPTSIGPLPCMVTGDQDTWKYQGVYLEKRTVSNGSLVHEKEFVWIDNKDQVDAYIIVGWMGNPQVYSWSTTGLQGTHVKYNVTVYLNYAPTPAAQGIVEPGGSLGPVTLNKYDVVTIKVYAVVDDPSQPLPGTPTNPDNPGNTTSTTTTPPEQPTSGSEELGLSRVVIIEKVVEGSGAALAALVVILLVMAGIILARR